MKLFNQYNIFKSLTIFVIFFMSLFVFYFSKNIHVHSVGYILNTELQLVLLVFRIMLLVVLPVIFLTILIAYYYRHTNILSDYRPNWNHSYLLEIICWLIPIVIIIFLANLSWITTHKLDPKKSLKLNINKPIIIEAVSLNWRWLFIYPYYKIATINEISFPKDTPIHLNITSHSIMNSFFIPNLGSQIYTMAGMKTELNLIANNNGFYKGISSNYSGCGFSNMKFNVYVHNSIYDFHKWIKNIKLKNNFLLFKNQFLCLAHNNVQYNVQYFSYIDPLLFYKIKGMFYHSCKK
ncbi:ubiquinol oxidase subunit II [Buchnera aphidicola]|nr:ubiquinol oxidase subunit II [Buchnera aphidicola]